MTLILRLRDRETDMERQTYGDREIESQTDGEMARKRDEET
jgi:hypothetical protein